MCVESVKTGRVEAECIVVTNVQFITLSPSREEKQESVFVCVVDV